jgi:hypothetical protein
MVLFLQTKSPFPRNGKRQEILMREEERCELSYLSGLSPAGFGTVKSVAEVS